MDLVNGEPVPRKSILKSRSRENSVCSDTSESSTADFEERRVAFGRMLSHDEATHSDTSDGITEEDSPTGMSPHSNGRFEVQKVWLLFLFLVFRDLNKLQTFWCKFQHVHQSATVVFILELNYTLKSYS